MTSYPEYQRRVAQVVEELIGWKYSAICTELVDNLRLGAILESAFSRREDYRFAGNLIALQLDTRKAMKALEIGECLCK